MTDKQVFNEVQAALLNSECAPKQALYEALLAVFQFAFTECELHMRDLPKFFNKAEKDGSEGKLW